MTEPVKFDKWGQWSHSAIHALGEEFDEVPFKDIPAFDHLEIMPIRIWEEDAINEITNMGESPADFRKWQPEPPKGDGWFPFSFSEDEDGPYVLYARNAEQPTQITPAADTTEVSGQHDIQPYYEAGSVYTGIYRCVKCGLHEGEGTTECAK